MTYSRKNVWDLGKDWADPILWYARGVAAMKAKALADHTSWRFYAAIHGIDPALWTQFGYLSKTDKMPSGGDQKKFWNQCQHGSWYFLPWHRGYLLGLEANVRAAVTKLGGPKDWALPYWNYFKKNENKLPPAFASPDWPDGKGNNPLFVKQRYGPNNDGNVYVDVSQVNMDALSDPDFTGVASGGSPGFGGVDTGFSHGGRVHGGVETQPHDWVHGLVGGGDPSDPNNIPGLMSDPDTAALDPIFWLHHTNIDRLWEAWRKNPPTDVDPTQKQWLKGPGSIGERAFVMPMPDGTAWNYTPADMSDVSKLNYQYDALTPAVVAPKARVGGAAVATGKNVELVGASSGVVKVSGGAEVRASVQMDSTVRQKVAKSLGVPEAGATAAPDRVFLNLENVRGLNDAAAFRVYINLPEGAKPEDHPELLAGSIALFGVRKATQVDAEHAGQGLTFVLEITKIVDALHLKNALDVNSLDVRIVPVKPIPEGAQISIGRISIYRQGN